MKRNRGFTLLELGGVIGIIGVLAAILLPALARARESGRRVSCMANMMNISVAFQCYAQEHNRQLPWSGGGNNARCLMKLQGDYTTDLRSFVCPSDNDGDWQSEEPEMVAANLNTLRNAKFSFRGSYDYLGAYTTVPVTQPPFSQPLPMRIPILWDIVLPSPQAEPNRGFLEHSDTWARRQSIDVASFNHIPGGSNVLMLDGSIEFIKWQEAFKPWMPADSIGIPYEMPQPPTEHERRRVESIARSPVVPAKLGSITPIGSPFVR